LNNFEGYENIVHDLMSHLTYLQITHCYSRYILQITWLGTTMRYFNTTCLWVTRCTDVITMRRHTINMCVICHIWSWMETIVILVFFFIIDCIYFFDGNLKYYYYYFFFFVKTPKKFYNFFFLFFVFCFLFNVLDIL